MHGKLLVPISTVSSPFSGLCGLVRRSGTCSPTSKANQREEAIIKEGAALTSARETPEDRGVMLSGRSALRLSYAKEPKTRLDLEGLGK